MEKIKIIYREPIEAEYKELNVYDNLNDYLNSYNEGKNFIRKGIGEWKRLVTNEGVFYSYNGYYDEYFLTEKCYKEMLKYCKKTYLLHESSLFRTQRNSNCRYTGELGSINEVIDYMKNDKGSWLPQIIKEIDEDIKEKKEKIKQIELQIEKLEEDKIKIYDEEYLKQNIEVEYTFDSLFYKSLKGDNNE